MNPTGGPMVNDMAYKLTVELPEAHRGYTKILARRLRVKTKDELIAYLIDKETATLYDYA